MVILVVVVNQDNSSKPLTYRSTNCIILLTKYVFLLRTCLFPNFNFDLLYLKIKNVFKSRLIKQVKYDCRRFCKSTVVRATPKFDRKCQRTKICLERITKDTK